MGPRGKGMAPTECASNPAAMVAPGKPEDSYFYAKVGGKAGPVCMSLMPLGSEGLDPASLELVRAWIAAGAPGPGMAVGDAGVGASDGRNW